MSRGTIALLAVNPSVALLKLEGRINIALLQSSYSSELQPIMCAGFIRCRCQFGRRAHHVGVVQSRDLEQQLLQKAKGKKKNWLTSRHQPIPTKKKELLFESRYLVFLTNCNSSAGTWNKTYDLCDITEGKFQNQNLLALCKVKQASDCRLISFTDSLIIRICWESFK